jgi:hypothetical protein
MYKKAVYPIKLTRGDYFEFAFKWRVADEYVDLTGWDARFQVRRKPDSVDAILDLTVDNGGITLDDEGGVIVMHDIDDELPLGVWVYDFEFIPPNGRTFTPFSGLFTIELGTTN